MTGATESTGGRARTIGLGGRVTATLDRIGERARAAWASDRVRLACLTVYYLAILIGLVWMRGSRITATHFVYQEF